LAEAVDAAGAGPQSVAEALSVIAQTPAVIRGFFNGLSEPTLSGSAAGEWGARQVLEHLIDVEGIAFRGRIGRILNEDRPFIRSIDPPARLQEGGYDERTLDELLTELETLRAESTAWLRGIDPADFDREGEHDEAGIITAGQLIHYWAVHDLVHLRQMLTALQGKLVPLAGNMHLFLED
jgi:hypothetical protein